MEDTFACMVAILIHQMKMIDDCFVPNLAMFIIIIIQPEIKKILIVQYILLKITLI